MALIAMILLSASSCSRPASRPATVGAHADAGAPTSNDDDDAHPLAPGRVAVFVEVAVGLTERFEELPAYAAVVEACFRAVPLERRSGTLPLRVRIAAPVAAAPAGDAFADPSAAGWGGPTYVEDAAFTACVTPQLPTVADLAAYTDLATGRIARAFVTLAYTRAADARAHGDLREVP